MIALVCLLWVKLCCVDCCFVVVGIVVLLTCELVGLGVWFVVVVVRFIAGCECWCGRGLLIVLLCFMALFIWWLCSSVHCFADLCTSDAVDWWVHVCVVCLL